MDELTQPLGQPRAGRGPRRGTATADAVVRAIAGALLFCLAVFGVWACVAEDPFGGVPVAVVATTLKLAPEKPTEQPTAAAQAPQRAAPPARGLAVLGSPPDRVPGHGNIVTIIDGVSGKRQEVLIAPNGGSEGPASNEGVALPELDVGRAATVDPGLIEMTRHGPIPRLGPNGTRAADSYASAVATDPRGPRIAIVLTGLAAGAAATSEALAKLPGVVTFAFSPYGSGVEQWVSRARGAGHEILLQVAMEPLEPDHEPGPQTLLTSLGVEQNLDRLHWVMSRFAGYVGVTNVQGARFTASEPAAGPVLAEIARRGLIYFDDATSSRSLAGQLVAAYNGAFARADIVVHALATTTEIDRALAELESLARERGVAVGVAVAGSIPMDRVAQWASRAEQRGLRLVPISAVSHKPKSI